MKGFLNLCDGVVYMSDEKCWKTLVYLISTHMCKLIKHDFTIMKGMRL